MTPLTELLVLLLTPGVPLTLAFALMVKPESAVLKTAGAWSALPALVTSWLMSPGIAATVPWILQGSEFGIDAPGRTFLFFTAAIWLAAGITARDWLDERDSRFLINFLLVMGGSLGLIISRDMLAFYLFFTVMSFASYGLVVHDRSQTARQIGRIYLTFVLAGDMMIFAALVLISHEGGGELLFEAARAGLPNAANRHAAFALLLLGFGIKAGLLGVHVTLPLIYQVAPIPAAVVLAGGMINAGLLGWLRLLPLGTGAAEVWGTALVAAGVAAAFYGALVGSLQRQPRVVLAYSSISQMGIMTAGVGVALGSLDPGGVLLTAVSLYALHHAFAKAALFLGWGVAQRVDRRWRWWIGLGLGLPALALAGAPLTTGMLAKETLKEALSVAEPSIWLSLLKALLPWMAFATTLVLARFLWLVWRLMERPLPPLQAAHRSAREGGGTTAGGRQSLSRAAVTAWAGLVLLSLSAAWLVPRESDAELWSAGVIREVTWPVLLGIAVSLAAAMARPGALTARLPAVPPGDVLVVIIWLGSRAVRAWNALARRLAPAVREAVASAARRGVEQPSWSRAAAVVERVLVDWRTGTILVVLVVLAVWVLLWPA